MPKFKSPDKKLVAKVEPTEVAQKRIRIEFSSPDNTVVKIDEDKKRLLINTTKHSYIPLKVAKSLFKIGYSLMDESDLSEFRRLHKLLLSAAYDTKQLGNPFFRVFTTFCPGPSFSHPMPLVFQCKKKDDSSACPTYTHIIYFQNYVYQFFIPFYEKDSWMKGRDKTFFFHLMPPLYDKRWAELFGKPRHSDIDLSSSVLKKNEPQYITMSFDIKFRRVVKN